MQIGSELPEMHNTSRELHDALVVVAKGKFIGGVMKVKLGELTKIKTGKLDANASSPDGEYPFFTCSKEPLKISSYSYDCECVLVAGNGDLNVKYYNGKFDAYQRTYIIEDNSNGRLYLPYLYYFMNGYVEELRKLSIGGVIKYIKLRNLTDALIELPDIETQKYIVSILSKIKELIGSRYQELKILENLIKARFVEMFGHQSHNEKSLPYMTIDDVAEIYLGITHTPTYVDSGVIFISAKNTSGDFLDLSDVKYISREEFEGAPKGSKPKANDVLFSRVGSNLGHPVILEEELELCTFVSLGFLRSKGTVTSNYLKHWMRDEFFARQVSEHVKGGGQPNLNTGWLKEFKIIVPDMDQQKKFDAFCCQIDKSKATVQKALDETQLLFDSLMQQYFG